MWCQMLINIALSNNKLSILSCNPETHVIVRNVRFLKAMMSSPTYEPCTLIEAASVISSTVCLLDIVSHRTSLSGD